VVMAELEMPLTPEPEEMAAEGEEEEVAEEAEAPADDDEMAAAEYPEAEDEAAEEEKAADEEEEWLPDHMIEELGHGEKYVVKMRQKLRTPKAAAKFIDELSDLISRRKSEDKTTVFEDFDISQNLIPTESFEDLFSELADSQVQVERFRAFGCPTIDDEVALMLSGWLSAVAGDMAPFEMHLSDCAIQTNGFLELVQAFQDNEAFPPIDPRNPSRGQLPLYLRLEGNYISKDVMQEKVDEGTCMTMRKTDRPRYTTEHKVRILVREDGSFAQKTGEPPAPADAPPPKRVHDDKGKGKGKDSKGKDSKGRDAKGKGRDSKGKDRHSERYSEGKGQSKNRSSAKASPERTSHRDRREAAPWDRTRAPARAPDRWASQDDRWKKDDRGDRGNRWTKDERTERREDRGPSSYDSGRGDARARPNERAPDRYASSGRVAERAPVRTPPPPARTLRTPPPAPSRNSHAGARDTGAYRSAPKADAYAARPAAGRPTSSRGDEERKRPFDSFSRGGRDDEAAKRQRTAFVPTSSRADSRPTADRGKGQGKKGGNSGKPSRGEAPLPSGWEEHYSEEYKLNYFWNSKNGESNWERPRR